MTSHIRMWPFAGSKLSINQTLAQKWPISRQFDSDHFEIDHIFTSVDPDQRLSGASDHLEVQRSDFESICSQYYQKGPSFDHFKRNGYFLVTFDLYLKESGDQYLT